MQSVLKLYWIENSNSATVYSVFSNFEREIAPPISQQWEWFQQLHEPVYLKIDV